MRPSFMDLLGCWFRTGFPIQSARVIAMGTPHLLPSLARAVRGLSALFWGLPLALLACVKTAMGDSWRAFGTWGSPLFRNQGWTGFLIDLIQACLPATAALVLLLYGLRNLARFQSQERIWIGALDRATILNSLLLALVPFAHWWSIRPFDPFYTQSLGLMIFSGIGFMMAINRVLLRLAAMLPDEVLRSDTRLFSQVNAGLIGLLGLLIATQILAQSRPGWVPLIVQTLLSELGESGNWLFVMLALVPLALTMTLLWKAKEAIVASVFRPGT